VLTTEHFALAGRTGLNRQRERAPAALAAAPFSSALITLGVVAQPGVPSEHAWLEVERSRSWASGVSIERGREVSRLAVTQRA
jgi:hypothetical protein